MKYRIVENILANGTREFVAQYEYLQQWIPIFDRNELCSHSTIEDADQALEKFKQELIVSTTVHDR